MTSTAPLSAFPALAGATHEHDAERRRKYLADIKLLIGEDDLGTA